MASNESATERILASNGGAEGSLVVECVKNLGGDHGYNVKTSKYENLMESGVIDPAKVARIALENAASIAGMLLTTEAVVVEEKEENPMPNPGMGGGGMPGMM